MVLSGLIFIPMCAVPTVLLLKKNFQIKVFYTLTALVHFVFSIGLLAKHGYLFGGSVLKEKSMLYPDLGLQHSVYLDGASMLLILIVSSLYLLFGALALDHCAVKAGAVKLLMSQVLATLILCSSNLLVLTIAVLIFTLMNLMPKVKSNIYTEFRILSSLLGFALLVGVSLILGILYESVYGFADLDVMALSEMRTPFVKGSAFSTQFVLFLSYCTGFIFTALSNFLGWLQYSKCKLNLNAFLPLAGMCLSIYVGLKFILLLFPETTRLYLPELGYIRISLMALTMFLIFYAFFQKSMTSFFERGEHV